MATIQRRPEQDKEWTVRWREGGKHRRKSFRLKSEAKQYLAEAEAVEGKQRAGTWKAPPEALDRTVEQQAEQWQRSRKHLSESSQVKDASVFNAWINPECGDVKLSAVRKHHLENILADMVDEGLSSAHRKDVYSRFCMMMDHAIGTGSHNLRDVRIGTVRRERPIQPFTEEEWARLLRFTEAKWVLYVDVMGTLGLRPQECAALSPDQFVFQEATVTIDRAVKSSGKVETETKNGTVRTLVLPDHLVRRLREACDQPLNNGTIWPWPGKINLDNWRRNVWDSACEAAGFEDRVPYDLRHTCASRLIAMGANVIDVAEWMGHSKSMTLETYGHMFPGRKAELAGMLSRGQEDADVVELRSA